MNLVTQSLPVLTVILAWVGFSLKFQFPFLLTKRPFIIYLKQKASYFIILAWLLIFIFFLIDNEIFSTLDIILVLIASVGTIFGRYFVVYDKIHPKLVNSVLVTKKIKKIIREEPEVAVLKFINSNGNNTVVHLYPVALLRVGDFVYKSTDLAQIPDYSLTYCLLCNTIHAYYLPEFNGKKIEISSNNGSVLNGNKILSDKSGTYIWQQFTGEGLTSKTKDHPLQEIPVKRYVWEHAYSLFPDSYIYVGPRKFLSRIFFGILSKLVRKYDKFSFSIKKSDPRLRRKELISGIEVSGIAKAYPIGLFDPKKPSLIEDIVGNQTITLVYDHFSTIAFSGSGLSLKDGILSKDNRKWKLTGESIDGGSDLKEILVTEKAYWYSWSAFHPDTQIYEL